MVRLAEGAARVHVYPSIRPQPRPWRICNPDEQWGEVPWAVLSVRPGASVTAETVQAHLDGTIARYQVPKNVVLVDELPRTASGKVRKADLRARFGG